LKRNQSDRKRKESFQDYLRLGSLERDISCGYRFVVEASTGRWRRQSGRAGAGDITITKSNLAMNKTITRIIIGTLVLVTLTALPTLAQPVAPAPLPPGYKQAEGLTMKVNGVATPILQVELSHHDREVFDVVSFTQTAPALIELTFEKPVEAATILPAGYGIKPAVSGKVVRFNMDRPRQLFVQIPGRNQLVILGDGPATLPEPKPGPGVFDIVERYQADPSGKKEATVAIQKAIDDAAVNGGIVLVPRGTFRSGKLTLKDNVRLHLAEGAALKFVDEISEGFDFKKKQAGIYFISTSGSKNMAITGHGLLDCNGQTLHGADKRRRLISAFHSSHVTGLTLEGITIIDSTSWTLVPAFSQQLLIRNLKIVNTLCLYEDDGIDPLGCQDVLVDHCLVVATDDAFCPKPGGVGSHGGGAQPGPAIELRDVVFNDCVAWTHAAGFKLGAASSVPALNIVAKNSHVVCCSRGVVIEHAMGNAPARNVLFQDITVEGHCKSAAVAIKSNRTAPVSEVTYDRVKINSAGGASIQLDSKDAMVSKVKVIDCTIHEKPVVGGKGNPTNIYREPDKRQLGYTLTAVWGTNPEAGVAGKVATAAPAVLVTDRENRPVPGVEVVFSVESGDGAVKAPTAISDARGIAVIGGWILGKTPGVNALIARSKATEASHVVFMTKGL